MTILLKISHLIDSLNQWITRFITWLVLLMIFIGVWNVIGRYVGRWLGYNLTSNSLIELQWYLFDLVFLFGTAYTLKNDGHVRVDIFYKDWSQKKKAIADFLGTILFLIPFCILIIYYSFPYVINSWIELEKSGNEGGLPVYPIKTMIIVGWSLLLLQGISEAIKNFAIMKGISINNKYIEGGEK